MAKAIDKYEAILLKGISKYLTHSDPKVRKTAKRVLEINVTDNQKARITFLQQKYTEAGKVFEEVRDTSYSLKEIELAFNTCIEVGNLYIDLLKAETLRLKELDKDLIDRRRQIEEDYKNLKAQRLKEEKRYENLLFFMLIVLPMSICLLLIILKGLVQ